MCFQRKGPARGTPFLPCQALFVDGGLHGGCGFWGLIREKSGWVWR